MQELEIYVPNYGRLRFIGSCLHRGHDFAASSNSDSSQFDALVWLDSRGVSRQLESSLVAQIIEKIESKKMSYLMVCRPLELTMWSTLMNFMKVNRISPGRIITNMGMVDFTPKKKTLLDDAVDQVAYSFGKDAVRKEYVGRYAGADGEMIMLYAMRYSSAYIDALVELVSKQDTLIINTPLVSSNINISRRRPESFYEGLEMTVDFNRALRRGGAVVIEPPAFDDRLTYDAVHYTDAGNTILYNLIERYL